MYMGNLSNLFRFCYFFVTLQKQALQLSWFNCYCMEVQNQPILRLICFCHFRTFFWKKFEEQISVAELSNRLLVHEYGHTVQSLILGPLYLFVIGIPSTLWGFLGGRKRRDEQIPYGAFFTEKWANSLGEQITGEKSIENLVLE